MGLHWFAFCCQVRKDLSITDAHASSSELQFPNKFIRIRKEECNRIFKNKKCYPGRIWSPGFPRDAAMRNAMRRCSLLSDQFVPVPHNLAGAAGTTRVDQLRETEIES